MKKIREFVRDLIDENTWFVAIIFVCGFIYLLQASGFAGGVHHFVESFWESKRF